MSLYGKITGREPALQELAKVGDITLALQQVSGGQQNDYFDPLGRRKHKDLKPLDKERLYFRETQTLSGINKTAKKMFKNWFDMDDPRGKHTINETVKDDLVAFHKDINLKSKKIQQTIDAMVHGNGFLELIPARPSLDSKMPITPQMGLYDVVTVDPLYILPKIEQIDNKGTEWYYLEIQKDFSIKKIHNSRIDHVKWFSLGTMPFGYGVPEVALRTMLEKMRMDWAIGEIIYKFGKPFLVLNTTGMIRKELPAALKLLQNISPSTGFAGSDRHKFTILNPETIDPEPFAQYYYRNMAAALEMPIFEFLGAQRGQVTGGEVDLAGWHDILLSNLEAKFTPSIHRINNHFMSGNWKDEIFWNQIYVDEESQSKIEKLIAETAEILHTKAGVVMDTEVRQYLRNKGMDWILEENDEEFIPEETPTPEDKPDDEKPEKNPFFPLSEMDRRRIKHEKELADKAFNEGRAK